MDEGNKDLNEGSMETLEEPAADTGALQTSVAGETTPQVVPPSQNSGQSSGKPPFWQRLREMSNLYLVVFLLIVAAAIAATVLVLTWNNNKNPKNKSSSLTSDQLGQLSGNTTIVGDAKQTLDIQGNTVLEGQLLVRKDVNIAGSIKVGGGLSLSSATIGNQLEINGDLSVAGDTTFSGSVNVKKNLSVTGSGSFGSLSASQLTISSLQLNGDIKINRHITLGGSLPSKTNGSALGSGGTASVNGTDTAGTITINTGGSPPAGCFVTITFSHAFASTPHVVISPSNSSAAGLNYYSTRTSSNFKVCTTNTPSASKTYAFDYIVID